MKQWKRLLYYLMINVIVSACMTLIILSVWDRTHPQPTGGDTSPDGPANQTATALAYNTDAALKTVEALRASPTTPPTKTPSVKEYTVKQNDSLGEIATMFDVTVEELMEFNALVDPNSIPVGLVLFIPVTPAIPTETPAITPTEVLTSTMPAGPVQEARVVINSVIGVGNLSSEHVFLTRTGDGELSLSGWTLEDDDGNVFTFPQLELYKDGGVNVWTTTGTPTVVDLYWGSLATIWGPGELVTLRDAQGKEHTTYQIP